MGVSVDVLVVVGGPVRPAAAKNADEVREGIVVLCGRRHRQLDFGAFRKGQRFRGLKDAPYVSGFDGRGHGLHSAIILWESAMQYTEWAGDCEVRLKGVWRAGGVSPP